MFRLSQQRSIILSDTPVSVDLRPNQDCADLICMPVALIADYKFNSSFGFTVLVPALFNWGLGVDNNTLKSSDNVLLCTVDQSRGRLLSGSGVAVSLQVPSVVHRSICSPKRPIFDFKVGQRTFGTMCVIHFKLVPNTTSKLKAKFVCIWLQRPLLQREALCACVCVDISFAV